MKVRETSEVREKLHYWSNAAGDLFNPHDKSEDSWISASKLPAELSHAWNTLYSEDTGSYCYLVELNGEFGIMLSSEYAKEDGLSHEDVIRRGEEVAKLFDDLGINGQICAGISDEAYLSDDFTDELLVFMPADISVENFNKTADFIGKTAYKKDAAYEMYKDQLESVNIYGNGQKAPEKTYEEESLDVIKNYYESDLETETASAEYLSGLLLSDDVHTYNSVEKLCRNYVEGNEEYRKGLDQALDVLVGYNLREIVENIMDEIKEKAAEEMEIDQ